MGEPGVKKRKKQSLIDARSKAYRQHRERLKASRLKRQESRNKRDKFTESIVSEMTYGAGTMAAARPTADMSNINAAKSSSGYELYHKIFHAAMQHAYQVCKKEGYTVDSEDIDSKLQWPKETIIW